MWYLVYVKADGSTGNLVFATEALAESLFHQFSALPDVVYAHYAQFFEERSNWYCQPH